MDGRRADHDAIDALIAAWTRGEERFALAERLQRRGVAAMPVMTNRDLFESAQLRERGFIVDWEQPRVGTFEYAGFPLHFSDAPASTMRGSPALGGHNREILSELGFSSGRNRPVRGGAGHRRHTASNGRQDLTDGSQFETFA